MAHELAPMRQLRHFSWRLLGRYREHSDEDKLTVARVFLTGCVRLDYLDGGTRRIAALTL